MAILTKMKPVSGPVKKYVTVPRSSVRAARSSAGIGLFATAPISKGACIIEYVGREISEEEKYTSRSKYLFEVNSNKTIDGKPPANLAGYINHSCRPNCEPEIKQSRVFIYAKRNIKAGEELTYDYGTEYKMSGYFGPDGCRCEKCTA